MWRLYLIKSVGYPLENCVWPHYSNFCENSLQEMYFQSISLWIHLLLLSPLCNERFFTTFSIFSNQLSYLYLHHVLVNKKMLLERDLEIGRFTTVDLSGKEVLRRIKYKDCEMYFRGITLDTLHEIRRLYLRNPKFTHKLLVHKFMQIATFTDIFFLHLR